MSSRKFTTQSDIELYKALQKHGKLSFKKQEKITGMPTSTIQYAYDRLQKREFYEIVALPKLEEFPELPIAIISFTDLHPIKLNNLKKNYLNKEEVRAFITNNKEVVLILMHVNRERLAELIFEIIKKTQAMPTVNILSPTILKLNLTIPDKILDAIYPDLQDRTKKRK